MSRMSISYILVAECPIVKCCPMSAATSWSMTGTETSNIIMSCPAPSARSAWQMTASTLSPHGLLENCCTLCSPAGKHKNDPTRRAFRRAVLLIGNQTFMKKKYLSRHRPQSFWPQARSPAGQCTAGANTSYSSLPIVDAVSVFSSPDHSVRGLCCFLY